MEWEVAVWCGKLHCGMEVCHVGCEVTVWGVRFCVE